MAIDFFMGKGDQLPKIATTLEDTNGAIDLTGATVTLYARKVGATTIFSGSVTVATDQVANKGQVTYSFGASDTLVPGRYFVKWVAVIGGLPITFPNSGADEAWIDESWGSINE